MHHLPRKLQSYIGKNSQFFDFFQQHYAEGYWFWEVNKGQELLVDYKYAKKFNLKAGVIELNKLANKALKNSISHAQTKIEKASLLGDNESDFSLVLDDQLHQLEIKYHLLEDPSNQQQYIFAALHQTMESDSASEELIDILDIGIWQWNIKTHELIINKKCAELLGYSHQELQSMSIEFFEELAHTEYLEEIKKEIANCLAGHKESFVSELRLRHKNGHYIWVCGKGKLLTNITDGKPEWIKGSCIDITEKKLYEQEIDSLSLVALKTNSSVIIADKEGKILFVNKAFENLTGYTLREVIGKRPGDFLHGKETQIESRKELSQKMKSGKAFTHEILNYTKNDEKYWTSLHVNPVYNEKGEIEKYMSVQTDISEQKKYEDYLSTFKSTLDQTEDCVFLFDQDSLQFIYVNKGAELMMEYSSEELLQLHPYDIKPEFPEEDFRKLVTPLINGTEKSLRFETVHRLKSGKDIPVEVFLQFIKKDISEPHFVAIVHDITNKKALEKEIQQLSLVAEKTHNLVVIANKKGLIEYVNPAFERKTGYSLDEVIGEKPGYFLHGPETNPEHVQSNRENLKKLKPFTQEILNYTRSGEKYWVSITFNPVFNKEGELQKFIAIETDITERKTREEELQKSEERLTFVLEGSELGYWDWHFETDELNVNDRWLEMLGYNREELTPSIHSWHDLVHPDDKPKLGEIMEDIFPNPSKNDFEVEIRAKHKKGHYIWVLDKGAVVERDKEGKPFRITGIHSEISKRKELEQSLQDERAFLSGIMNNNAAAVIVLDSEGLIKYTNPSAHKVIGFSSSDLVGRAFFDPKFKMFNVDGTGLSIEDHPFSILKKKNEAIYDQRIAFEGPNKTMKYISMSGAPMTEQNGKVTEYVFSILDITERVQTQFQLEQTKIQLESILSEMSDVIWSVSLPDLKLLYVTPSIQKIYGKSQTYYIGNFLENIWQNTVYEKDKGILKNALEMLEKTGSYEVNYRIHTEDGEIKHLYNKGKYIYQDEKPIRLDGYIADVTEKVNKEDELKKYLEVVEGQNNRLKNFTYIVSHNLRSHSANMQGLMHLIKDMHPEIYENDYVQKLDMTASKLDETLHQLNDVVSVVSSVEQMKKVNVHEKVKSLHNAFSNLLSSSDVQLINQVGEDIYAEAVPPYLESILTNLITNAVKYRDPEKKSYVKLWDESVNGEVNIFVEDNGLGLDLEKHGNKLFGMYKTFHTHKDSRGIGLFLAKNQAESMGAKIHVESTVGIGTTFKLILKK